MFDPYIGPMQIDWTRLHFHLVLKLAVLLETLVQDIIKKIYPPAPRS